MARTFPSAGVSPCDYYNVDDRSTAYFEHVVTAPDTTEFRNVYAVSTVTLISGANYIGVDSRVTTAGTAGAWVSALYCKVTQGSTKNVNGYLCAAEFELTNSAANVSDWFVIVLNASNSGAQQGSHSSYIALRDYGSTDIQSLLWVSTDHTIGTKSDTALMTTFADGAHISHAIRIIAGATPYWILCSSQAPSGT